MNTKKIFTQSLLNRILMSIPPDLYQNLQVKEREPVTIQFLKLSIQAFFNNVLRSPFMDLYGNYYLKALWLDFNIDCAKMIFNQHNFLDFYPFVEKNSFFPGFIDSENPNDINYQWRNILEQLPYIYGGIGSLIKMKAPLKIEILHRFKRMADEEKHLLENLKDMAVNLMFETGEYNNAIDSFIDLMLPIDRNDQQVIISEKEQNRISLNNNTNKINSNNTMFSDKYICLLAKTKDGEQIVSFMSNS